MGAESPCTPDLPPEQQGELLDTLTEINRMELKIWGNATDAAIMRYIDATDLKAGRAAKVSAIAHALGLGVGTVHARLKRLQAWQDPHSGETMALVHRTREGYRMTEHGRERSARLARLAESALQRYQRLSNG